MIRRPPRSTLFPYPPLSRSAADRRRRGHSGRGLRRSRGIPRRSPRLEPRRRRVHPAALEGRHGREELLRGGRSEEHTSELQSRLHLVCRLLLEKKKRNTQTKTSYHAPFKRTAFQHVNLIIAERNVIVIIQDVQLSIHLGLISITAIARLDRSWC